MFNLDVEHVLPGSELSATGPWTICYMAMVHMVTGFEPFDTVAVDHDRGPFTPESGKFATGPLVIYYRDCHLLLQGLDPFTTGPLTILYRIGDRCSRAVDNLLPVYVLTHS